MLLNERNDDIMSVTAMSLARNHYVASLCHTNPCSLGCASMIRLLKILDINLEVKYAYY
jgi:hypothetical protein